MTITNKLIACVEDETASGVIYTLVGDPNTAPEELARQLIDGLDYDQHTDDTVFVYKISSCSTERSSKYCLSQEIEGPWLVRDKATNERYTCSGTLVCSFKIHTTYKLIPE